MNGVHQNVAGPTPARLFCPDCGEEMRIRPQHLRSTVACPHCREPIEPWRLDALAGATEARPGPLYAGSYSWRNRWVAGTLGILLGVFGVHRFYLGYKGLGLLQVLLTVGSFFVLTPFVAVWTFIEGILCFVGAMDDADGLPLSG